MKHYIKVWYSICLLIGLFASCNDDRNNVVPTGILYLNVEEDGTLQTRATTDVTYESLQVAILKGEEDTLKVYNDYLKEVKGQRLVLPVGKYTVAVCSNGVDGAGWETPLYRGQEEVEVKQGEITNTKITCTIANTKVSVVYGKSVQEHFTDYQTTVSNSSGSLTYTRDEYRAGFFTPEKLTVQLKLVNNDGNEFTIKKVYPDIEPKYHYTFEFTISNEDTSDDAGADFDIDVDDEHKEITYNIFIKKEDLTGAGEPSMKLGGAFTADGIYSFKRTEQSHRPNAGTIWLDYTLGSKNSLQSFVVTMNSPTLGKLRFDISKGEGGQIGFPALPESPVDSSDPRYATYRMDISAIVEHLDCKDDQPTLHTFTVDILDDKYQEVSMAFTIKIMPDVSAYVENPICWTTFAVLQGVCLDESCYFRLQIGDDVGNVKDIRPSKRNKNDGYISALVTGLNAGNSYKYWIVSDENADIKCEPINFDIQKKIEVPNLGFEDWSERKKAAVAFGMGGTFMTPNNVNSSIYWDSGNWGASAAGATLTSSTSENATAKSSLGAFLKSQYAAKLGVGAFAAGSAFVGEAQSVSSSGATLKYGHQHNGYPTCLRGYYKYTPGTINYTDTKGRTPSGVKEGDTDQCFIYIALGTKSLDVVSTTSEIKVFNKEREGIFAYGEYITTKTEDRTGESTIESVLNGYAPFKIPLIYKENPPKDGVVYLFIVATASRYGDYFTGSTSSELYIDEFSLDYDYNAASFVGTEFEGMTPININD